MAGPIRRRHEAVDYAAIERMFPPPPEYFETAWFDPPELIQRRLLARLQERALTTYEVPFFRRRWDEAGFHPTDLKTLDDLWKAPFYTVDDIRKSIDDHPPYGDYQGVTPADAVREPMRVYMSGGTTGKSRPTFYTQWDREVGAVLTARALYMQGIRPGDVVLNSWAYGTHNGAFAFDEALHRWLNCVVLTTGDYLLRLADVAREMGYDPSTDFKLSALPNIGDRERLESTFGPECFNSYGFHEVQWVSVECPVHDGLHIFEDAFIVQIVDPETGDALPDGEPGSICITELYKTGSPQFRYNIMDLSYLYPRERCACGSWLRRMGPFQGRGDNMVKLRGVNVWPEAIGEIALSVPGVAPDWFVRAVRVENRDELVVSVASDRDPAEFPAVAAAVEERLKERLGVRIVSEVVRPGELDAWTEVNVSPKLKRFRDER